MPGFAADDSQETHPETYFSPAASLSSNFTSKSSNAGYGGGYQGGSSGSGGNASPVGYSGNPDTSVTSRGGGSNVASKDSGPAKAASSSMVDSISGSGSSDTMGGRSAGDAIKSPALPDYDQLYQNQQIPKASPTQNLHYAGVLAALPNPETGRPYYSGPATPKGVKSGAFTAAVVDFQNANGFIKDGLIGIGPYAQTGPALDAAHAAMKAAPVDRSVQSAPALMSPMGAVANAPVSSLEAARARPAGPAGGTPPSSRGAAGVSSLEAARTPPQPRNIDVTAPADMGANGPLLMTVGMGALSGQMDHAAEVAKIIAPYTGTRGQAGASRMPTAAAAPAPATSTPGYPREPNMTATRNRRTGTPGRVPTNPTTGATDTAAVEGLSPGVQEAIDARAAAAPPPVTGGPSMQSGGITEGLQGVRRMTAGMEEMPGSPAAASSLEAAKPPETASSQLSMLDQLRQTLGVYEPPAGASMGPGSGAMAIGGARGVGTLAPQITLRADLRQPQGGAGAGAQPSSADKVLNILGIGQPAAPAATGGGGIPADTSSGVVTPADKALALSQNKGDYSYQGEGQPAATGPEGGGAGIPWSTSAAAGPQASDDGAHAAALKQVTDMMANQPAEKQKAVADHMVIFAHAASLVAAAPPEQRAAAFDEQLTRLKSMGAIDDATEKKLRGTTPSDAMLNQMIELGKAVHDMGVGQPQSSLEQMRRAA